MTRRIFGLFFALFLAAAATGCDAVPDTCAHDVCEDGGQDSPDNEALPPMPHPEDKLVPSGLPARGDGAVVHADLSHVPFGFAR